jgi:HEAT repeat protein
MKPPRLRLRLRHLLALVAASAGFFAVMQYRQGVYDPASAQARRLRSLDPAARLGAADALGRMGPDALSAIPSLLGALNDGDARVRRRVALALTEVLRRANDEAQVEDVRGALTAALGDPDPGARHAAAVALGEFRPDPKVAIPALIEAAGDDDPQIRGRAVGELGGFDDGAARAVIAAATRDREAGVRLQAVSSLSWHHVPARLPAIRAALSPRLKDENEFVRAYAVRTLGGLDLTTSIDAPELIEALADPSPWVRTAAVTALSYHAGSRAILPALVGALADPDPQVRGMAAQRLGRIGLDAEPALPALRPLRDDKDDAVRPKADEAIRSIEAKLSDFRTKLLPDALADLASPDPEVRRGAADRLGLFGPRSAPAVPTLMRSLDDRDGAVRLASVRALGRIGPPARDALPALIARATDADDRVRRAVMSAASAIRDEAGP